MLREKVGSIFSLDWKAMFAAVCAKIVRLDFFFIPNINISYFKEQHINLEKSETITKKIYKCYLCLWKNCITVTESDCVTLPYCMKIKSWYLLTKLFKKINKFEMIKKKISTMTNELMRCYICRGRTTPPICNSELFGSPIFYNTFYRKWRHFNPLPSLLSLLII